MNKLTKIVAGVLVALIGLIALILIYAFVFYPPEYTLRVLRWRVADVYDYQRFPARTLPASDTPFQFGDEPDEELVRSIFEEQATIDDLEAFLKETSTHAFIIIQDDAILYENYFNGADRESIVTSFSMAKSFASALIGIAIAEGYIDSVDDPITDYLPELAERDPAFTDITIRDLLLMSSGIRYQEFPFVNGDDSKTYYYPDLRDLALNQTEIVAAPGDEFLYNNYHPLLLGMILERTSGVPVADYLAKKIWQPMGAAYDGSWSLDARGYEKMESGINGRALDFAKFGRLFLHEGDWDGEQVIPAEWVQESTTPDPSLTGEYYPDWYHESYPHGFYKYLWWGTERADEEPDFAARGNYGQTIYVSPHKDLIIVRHGEKYGVDGSEWMRLFYEFASAIPASN